MATKRLLEILWPGLLIYIQEMFWVGDQGEGTSPSCTLYFSDFRTSFSFSLWLGEWDHFTRRTETFQKISNMYGYLFVHIILHGFSVNSRWWGEGGMVSVPGPSCRPSVQGVNPPVCCVLDDICKRQFCGFPQCAASWMTYARDSFVDSPSVLRPGWHMQETVLWIPPVCCVLSRGGPRHIGTSLTILIMSNRTSLKQQLLYYHRRYCTPCTTVFLAHLCKTFC